MMWLFVTAAHGSSTIQMLNYNTITTQHPLLLLLLQAWVEHQGKLEHLSTESMGSGSCGRVEGLLCLQMTSVGEFYTLFGFLARIMVAREKA